MPLHRHAICLLCLLCLLLVPVGGLARAEEQSLTSTAIIRALDRSTAERHLPVEVRGIVTYAYPRPKHVSFVVEQAGTGIYVSVGDVIALPEFVPRDTLPVVHVGDEVLLRGVTAAGGFSPCILPREIQILGTATLPPPHSFVLGDVLSGAMDCKRVEVRGVVHGAEARRAMLERLHLELATPGQRFVVNLVTPGDWTPEQLVGATVRLHAICFPFFNQRGELLGIRLQVARPEDVAIEKPAPSDPFAVPQVELTRMQPFSPEGSTLERRRLAGIVTLCRPAEFLFVEVAGRSVRVNTRSAEPFAPGDCVEASGFIQIRDTFAELQEAVVRKIGSVTPPPPIPVTREAVLAASVHETPVLAREDYNNKLVTLDGRFERAEITENDGRRIFFVSGGQAVSATLDRGSGAGALDDLRPGSLVKVTGICEVQFSAIRTASGSASDFPVPSGLSLLLRSPADVQVVRAAAWWTAERLWLLLGGISAVLAAMLGWNWLLRRQVERRGAQLAEEMRARSEAAVEFKSTLRERERLAADLHDTLEQSLTGLSFQLQTAEALQMGAPDRSARHLGLARQLLTRSRDEVRRSIWNLRSQSLEGRSLADALRLIAASQAEGRAVRIRVETEGAQRPLPDSIAGNLLLFAQETLTNALKHAQAREIAIRLAFTEEGIRLAIEDDGLGFDLERAAGPKEGHFGLQGMRERIKRLGGTLEIHTAPRQGTRLSAQVPAQVIAASLAV